MRTDRRYTIQGKEVSKAEFLRGIRAGKSGVDSCHPGEKHTPALKWKVSFDGHGLNDALSEYAPRLATLTNEARRTSFGEFAERAINSHEALLEAASDLCLSLDYLSAEVKKQFSVNVFKDKDALEKVVAQAEARP